MTYAVLNLLVLAALAVALGSRLRRLRPGPIGWAAVVMLALTAVFDNAMIAAGLVEYAADEVLGLRLGLAPIEDFAYTIAAVAVMPVLWTVFGARSRRTAPDGPVRGTGP